jgi:hypothetical protein
MNPSSLLLATSVLRGSFMPQRSLCQLKQTKPRRVEARTTPAGCWSCKAGYNSLHLRDVKILRSQPHRLDFFSAVQNPRVICELKAGTDRPVNVSLQHAIRNWRSYYLTGRWGLIPICVQGKISVVHIDNNIDVSSTFLTIFCAFSEESLPSPGFLSA